jgi:acyl carrier protein
VTQPVTQPVAQPVAQVETQVRGVLAEVLPGGAAGRLDRDAPLRAAGLDSLRTVELVSALEERFEIRLVEDDLRDEYFASVAGLVALVLARRGAGGA